MHKTRNEEELKDFALASSFSVLALNALMFMWFFLSIYKSTIKIIACQRYPKQFPNGEGNFRELLSTKHASSSPLETETYIFQLVKISLKVWRSQEWLPFNIHPMCSYSKASFYQFSPPSDSTKLDTKTTIEWYRNHKNWMKKEWQMLSNDLFIAESSYTK